MEIDIDDITFKNFIKKFTYSSDPEPGNKIVMSNGAWASCLVLFKLEMQLKRIAEKE